MNATLASLPEDVESALIKWLENFNAESAELLAKGYQGRARLFRYENWRLVVKSPPSNGILMPLLRHTLRHEHQVYQRLVGFKGVPKCYGLYHGRYLVLEYLDGCSLRERWPEDKELFTERLLEIIKRLHADGIAHMDLKKRDNIMMVNGNEPRLIDFGVSVIYKSGFHPLNHYFFRLAKRFDINAWAKFRRRMLLSVTDLDGRLLYKQTFIEKFAKIVKRSYRKIFVKRHISL